MRGNQVPRIRIEPPRVDTDGDGAADLMEEYSYKLDEWQKLVLDSWLGVDENGNYTVTSGGLSVPRQNGKNVCIEAREFYGLVINGDRILHTAHQVRTSKKAFRRLATMFEDDNKPEIKALVKKIRYGIGEESIELNNGGLIEFTARTRQAARGFDGISLVVYDEAQELSEEQAEAIMAVLSASATNTRQILYVGTPPYLGCEGGVFQRFRASCIGSDGAGNNKHNSWHEWSIAAETVNDVDISDRKLWIECNPALGYRLTEEFTFEECKTLSKDGFMRERLGWWNDHKQVEVIDYAIKAEVWDACRSDEVKPEGKIAYDIKFSVDGSEVYLCGAVIPEEGLARISLIESAPLALGLSWLAEWLNERYKKASCVVIDGKNGVDVLIDKIRPTWKFKDSVIKANSNDVVAAASLLLNDLNEKQLTWFSGQDILRDSALNASKRKIGSGWGFGGSNSAPIEAAALAYYGCRTSKRNPQRKMLIG